MALHTDLPIHKRGCDLLAIAFEIQVHLPRTVKRSLGEKIQHHCMEMLDHMAMANASKQRARVAHIEELLRHQRAVTVILRVAHDSRYISHSLWGEAVQAIDSIGQQAGGWLKKTLNTAPAA